MNHHYADIRERITEAPKWWDEHAVPRYCDFAPDECADIYAKQVALVEIECQGCGAQFRVAFSWGSMTHDYRPVPNPLPVERVKELHYGDPPNAGCCPAGPTMNSVPRRVVEFWTHGEERFTRPDEHNPSLRVCGPGYFDWRRVPENEVAIDCEWAEESR